MHEVPRRRGRAIPQASRHHRGARESEGASAATLRTGREARAAAQNQGSFDSPVYFEYHYSEWIRGDQHQKLRFDFDVEYTSDADRVNVLDAFNIVMAGMAPVLFFLVLCALAPALTRSHRLLQQRACPRRELVVFRDFRLLKPHERLPFMSLPSTRGEAKTPSQRSAAPELAYHR